MSKITKREYNTKKVEIEAKILDINKKLTALLKWSDTLDYYNLPENTRQKLIKVGDYWNGLHYKRYELEQELRFLEDEWDKRNWTGSDWNSWDLITSNID